MEVTEVKVLLRDSPDKKMKAYVTVTFDNAFVVRNIKIIEGASGLFIAMPSRKAKHPCPNCNFKNELRSKYCNQCGKELPLVPRQLGFGDTTLKDGTQPEHKDIAHPITQSFREYLEQRVLGAYEAERAKGTASG